MTDLFDMLTTIARRRKTPAGSPFATDKSTDKWLRTLPRDSDYETHHALVEGLERFNAENLASTPARVKILLAIEAAGLPLQGRIVEQYLRNQSSFRLARQALWRESWIFWSLLADAWLNLLKQAYRGPTSEELRPHIAEMGVRALHYAGLTMRWDFHQSRVPAAPVWRQVHKLYRLLERDDHARQAVRFNGRSTDCTRQYTLIVLMGLVHPLGYSAQDIESIARILESCAPLPVPARQPDRQAHTHVIDLSLAEGAQVIDNQNWPQGHRLRYLDLHPLIAHLHSLDRSENEHSSLPRQMASLIERGGNPRMGPRTHRFGEMGVVSGMDGILAALAMPGSSEARPMLEFWTLRDESAEGMGFVLPASAVMPPGRLLAVSRNPGEHAWQLLAVRWHRDEAGQILLGTQRLSRYPKRVQVLREFPAPDTKQEKTWAIFLPLPQPAQGMSHLLLPRSHYRLGASLVLLDGEAIYRLHLGEVQENHEGWLRVAMEVIDREQFTVAA
ncbi:MAG: hypothetical protein ACK4R8_07520 [Thiobacillus sp.]